MLMVATTIVKLVITTATNHRLFPHHSNSNRKLISQAQGTNPLVTQAQRAALTQSRQVAGKTIKGASALRMDNSKTHVRSSA